MNFWKKKIPQKNRMVTSGVPVHPFQVWHALRTHHPKPPPRPPTTHPPIERTITMKILYEEEFLRETFQEGWDFSRRTFCEKGILREESDSFLLKSRAKCPSRKISWLQSFSQKVSCKNSSTCEVFLRSTLGLRGGGLVWTCWVTHVKLGRCGVYNHKGPL